MNHSFILQRFEFFGEEISTAYWYTNSSGSYLLSSLIILLKIHHEPSMSKSFLSQNLTLIEKYSPFLWTTRDSTNAWSFLNCWSAASTSCSFSSNHCSKTHSQCNSNMEACVCSSCLTLTIIPNINIWASFNYSVNIIKLSLCPDEGRV